MKTYRFKITRAKLVLATGVIFVTAGLAGSLPFIYYELSNHGSASVQALPKIRPAITTDSKAPLVQGQPVSISIASLNIKLPVINGYYDQRTRSWTLTSTSAQFATVTAQPNNKTGDTFIYGHALSNIFGSLPRITPGATAVITTANGYSFTYKFVSTYETPPTNSSVLHYSGPPMLTLQTCSGSFWQNRQMYLFSYDGYQKA